MFAGYYRRPRDVDQVIELVGLAEKANERVKTLSGGQKRRLDLGIALVGDPELVFLDEPTTGFDPSARRTAWELVRSLRSLGKTILLTTHYLDEAQQLADRVAVIREGSLVRIGTPAELIGAAPEVEIRYREDGREVVVATAEPTRALAELTGGPSPRAVSSRGSKCGARRSRTSTSTSSTGTSDDYGAGTQPPASSRKRGRRRAVDRAVPPRAADPAAGLLAEPRIRGVRLRLPADAVFAARRGVRGHHRRRPRGRPAARRDDRLRLRQHRLRRARDHDGDPARGRRAQACARDAAASRHLPRRRPRVDPRRVRTADDRHGPARAPALRRARRRRAGRGRPGRPARRRRRSRGSGSAPRL